MKHQEQLQTLEWTKQLLDWGNASTQARQWWKELEDLNSGREDLVLKLASELLSRAATIDDFFLACSYSGRDGVRENLVFLDTIRQDTKEFCCSCPAEDHTEKATPRSGKISPFCH